METVNASHFKTHFGEVLNAALAEPVLVERRGQPATVLISETEYRALQERAFESQESEKSKAFEEMDSWANEEIQLKDLSGDLRAEAIIAKHGRHWRNS